VNSTRPLRYSVRDALGAVVAEAETYDGARSAVVHISQETHQEAGHFRIHEARPPVHNCWLNPVVVDRADGRGWACSVCGGYLQADRLEE
jgi:hypothetical protein